MKIAKTYSFLTLLFLLVFIISCSLDTSLEKANKCYELYQFKPAIKQYKDVFTKEKDKKKRAEITFKIAESYRHMSDYAKAEQYYRKAVKLKYPEPTPIYLTGEMLRRQEKYEDAIIEYKNYIKENPGDTMGSFQLRNAENALKWKEAKTRYVVENEKALNSKANDFAPTFYGKDGIVLTSDRDDVKNNKLYSWTGLKYTDLFVSEPIRDKRARNTGNKKKQKATIETVIKFPKPTALDLKGVINTDYNEGAACFDKKFNTMYYTQCNDNSGKGHNCRIMVTRKGKNNEWTEPEVLPFCTDSFIKYGHPSLSPDEKKLYFSSDMPGGFGGHDIYMSSWVKRGKTWSDPVNLGPIINTAGDEMFPFIYSDNKTLYFSSDGHPGMGGLDIFYSVWDGEKWSKPVNMGPPINSGGDDFSIIVRPGGNKRKGYSGYFASNRPDSRQDDIYSFYMTPLKYTLTGTIFNLKTKEVIPDASVIMMVNDTGKMVATTDKSGGYKFDLKPDNNYSVYSTKKYFFDSEEKLVSTVDLDFSEDFVRDLHLDPFMPVDIELQGIYYGLDSFNLRPASVLVLDSLYKVLLKHPYIVVEIASHTDCRASFDYNMKLSENRAKTVVDYLIEKGIPADRLVSKGYGETKLVNRCACENDTGVGMNCTEEEHQQNRRTTFRILRTDYVYGSQEQQQIDTQLKKLQKPRKNIKKPKPEEIITPEDNPQDDINNDNNTPQTKPKRNVKVPPNNNPPPK